MTIKNPRLILGVLAVLAIVGIGGGFLYAKYKANPGQNQPPGGTTAQSGGVTSTQPDALYQPYVTSTGEVIGIGHGVRMMVPSGWSYQNANPKNAEMVSIYDCPDRVEIGSIFCEKEVYVSSASTGPEALLEYSNKKYDFAWYCSNAEYQICPTDSAKLAQVEHKSGYWTVASVGIAENAAVAIPHGKYFVVVFGFENDTELYRSFGSLLE